MKLKNIFSALGFFIFVIMCWPLPALAYIPPYWMIMSRMAENHGHGAYVVDQDVLFSHGDEPLVVNERWFVQGEQNMRLEVIGRRQLKDLFRLTYVYQNGRRYFIDENGVKKSEPVSRDWFEPYLHFRYSKYVKPQLVAQSIAPSISLKSELFKYTQKNPLPPPEPYVRLSRIGGVVTYAVGKATPANTENLLPGIWIEQDQFVLRKLRLSSQAELQANNYKEFSQGMKYPRELLFHWDGNEAKAQLNTVQTAMIGKGNKSILDPASLNFGENPKLSRILPEDTVIREFYSRFR